MREGRLKRKRREERKKDFTRKTSVVVGTCVAAACVAYALNSWVIPSVRADEGITVQATQQDEIIRDWESVLRAEEVFTGSSENTEARARISEFSDNFLSYCTDSPSLHIDMLHSVTVDGQETPIADIASDTDNKTFLTNLHVAVPGKSYEMWYNIAEDVYSVHPDDSKYWFEFTNTDRIQKQMLQEYELYRTAPKTILEVIDWLRSSNYTTRISVDDRAISAKAAGAITSKMNTSFDFGDGSHYTIYILFDNNATYVHLSYSYVSSDVDREDYLFRVYNDNKQLSLPQYVADNAMHVTEGVEEYLKGGKQ